MSIVRAPVGSLLKNSAPPKPAKAAKATAGAREESGAHLAFIRRLPCVVTGKRPVDAAHISFASKAHGKPIKGIGTKASDRWTVPLHHDVHMAQHAHPKGEKGFWKEQRIDPLVLAMRLYFEAAGDLAKGEAIILEMQAARGGAHG